MQNKYRPILYICFFILLYVSVLQHWQKDSPAVSYNGSGSDTTLPSPVPVQECYADIKKVALTFDDGPHSATTPSLLDGLRERGVKATFFVVGANADKNRDILKVMYEDGHLIGNHTNSHCNLANLSCEKALTEINDTNRVIYEVTGSYSDYLRPPFGECGKTLDASLTMFKVMWDIDPRDWSIQNAKSVAGYVISHVKDGDIILLHDIFDTSVDAALEIIDALLADGYEFVTVDEILFP